MKFVLLYAIIPDYTASKINAMLKDKYNIDKVDITAIPVNRLPKSGDQYLLESYTNHTLITDYWGLSRYDKVTFVKDLNDIDSIVDIIAGYFIKVKCDWTDDLNVVKKWLEAANKKEILAVDFETKDVTLPYYNHLTMVTLGWSYTKSIVIVFKDKEVQDYVLNWLVTTDVKQVYHNALFDVSHILYHTKKMPKYIEDTQLLAKVYKNHVNPEKRKTGLKILAKDLYQDWAEDKSSFDLYVDSSNYKNENMRYYGSSKNISQYNLPLIYYSAVDSAATYAVYQKFDIEEPNPKEWVFPTSEPRYNEEQFNQRHYYEFILKPAIPVIVKMMAAGQTIDLDKVKDMKQNVEAMKEDMIQKISNVPRVKEFHDKTDAARINAFLEPVRKSLVSPKYGPYKNDVATRTFVVNYWTGLNLEKVSAKDLKTMDYPICKLLDNKEFTHKDVVEAVNAYAEHKANTLNIRNNRIDKLENPRKYLEGSLGFNPFNYSQNTRLWQYLGLESEEVSKKTGEMSFSKTVLKQLAKTTKDDEVRFVLESYLEIAEAKNIITQYIPKYLESTIDGRVYGNIVMLGTLSGRLSGKSEKSTDESIKHKKGINLVTQPSSSSAFAKPVKQLFTAAKGKILASSDFTNLEGYCGALLTKDETSLRNLRLNFDT